MIYCLENLSKYFHVHFYSSQPWCLIFFHFHLYYIFERYFVFLHTTLIMLNQCINNIITLIHEAVLLKKVILVHSSQSCKLSIEKLKSPKLIKVIHCKISFVFSVSWETLPDRRMDRCTLFPIMQGCQLLQ